MFFKKKEKITYSEFLEVYVEYLFNTQETMKSRIEEDFLNENEKDKFISELWILRFILLHYLLLKIKKPRTETEQMENLSLIAHGYSSVAKDKGIPDDEFKSIAKEQMKGFEEYSTKQENYDIVAQKHGIGAAILYCFTDKIASLSMKSMEKEADRIKYFSIFGLVKQITDTDSKAFHDMASCAKFIGL